MTVYMPCPNPACQDGRVQYVKDYDQVAWKKCPRCNGTGDVEPKDDEEMYGDDGVKPNSPPVPDRIIDNFELLPESCVL